MYESTTASDAPLAGVRVVDLTTGPMEVLARHFVDLGAHVTRARVAAITRKESLGPVVGGIPVGSTLAALGTLSASLDLGIPAQRTAWSDLLRHTDILIENTVPGSREESVLDIPAIRARHPEIVVLSISDYGRDTGFASWQLTSPVANALTSELSRSGLPDREPLLPPGELPYHVAAAQAALLALSVYLDRLRTGAGTVIDFSVLEGAMAALDPGFGMTGSAAAGVPLSKAPRGRADERHKYPIIRCADGFVRICVLARRQWRGMFEWMGSPAEFSDPAFDNTFHRFESMTLLPAIGAFFADKTRAELESLGQQHGVPIASVLSLEEALASEQVVARGFFVERELAPGVAAPVPAGIVEIDGHRAFRHDPLVGEQPLVGAPILASRPRSNTRLPLDGLRVLDFGVIVVGGDTGRLLGDLGADVIKVENSAFPDGSRASQIGGRMSPGFAAGHRNKRSIGIDLRDPRGMAIVHDLVRRSDIVLTNFKPGVIESLGLDFASLRAINPGIAVIDSSAFGPTGPWSRRLGYGPLVRAAAGFTAQWIYPGESESFSDAVTVYPDHVCARIGAMAALALLVRRERTGIGGSASVAQSEVMLSHMAAKIAVEALERDGLRATAPERDAPWGLFPAAGDDNWLVITVRGDKEWVQLCSTMGRPDLSADAGLRHAAGRDEQRERVDAAVRDWTLGMDASQAMRALQSSGVPAGVMLRAVELPDWDFYRERHDFREEIHPDIDEAVMLENVQIHAPSVDEPPLVGAPLLGENTIELCTQLMEMDAATVDHLVDAGILEVGKSTTLTNH